MSTRPELGADGGILTRAQALASGLTDAGLGSLVKSGELQRVRHGAYVDGRAWRSWDAATQHRVRARAVLLNARTNTALSHVSAAVEYGADTWDLDLTDVDITRLDAKAGRREAGVRQHRGLVTSDDVCTHDGIDVTTAERTCVDLIACLDSEHALAVVNSLLNLGRCTIEGARAHLPGHRYWPGMLGADVVLTLADARVESVGESRCVHLFWRHSVPMPVPQHEIHDSRGHFLGRVDFAWPAQGVFLEFDGQHKYGALRRPGESLEAVILREKRREERICATGWVCIRITWADLAKPLETARRIKALLASRGVA